MKGWKFKKPNVILEEEILNNDDLEQSVKVKITKTLLNLNDFNIFSGDNEVKENTVLGSYGIGVLAEEPSTLLGLQKGDRVYIESKKPCNDCYNCNIGNKDKCFSPLIAGEDYDGFLRDFVSCPIDEVYKLPDSVSDQDALFINYISVCVNIIDTLNIEKGNYVAIVGTNNLSVILAQLLIYYQAVPIMISENEKGKELASKSGVYYNLTEEDNLTKEVSTITGGRMADKVVYICDMDLPVTKAFSLASYGAKIAFTGFTNRITSFSFNQAIKKQLQIYCINNVAKNTPTSINLLVNKAVNTSNLKIEKIKYSDISDAMIKASKEYKFTEIIVENV